MADLTREEVEDIALLARLELQPDEAERLRGELGAILGYIDKLRACDTTGVEPMTHAVPMDCPLREDVVAPSLPADDALAAAPASADGFFQVPKIIETER
jgi:aspartyl-tRNA(Asn)/glutamyl-tRNA(Gln) amidotransferase subunit C